MKKILILGSSGMLGHIVYHYLNETGKYCIVDTSFPMKANQSSNILNATNKLVVEEYILTTKPDVVVNCIGILIKGSQNDPSNAIYLNSFLPHQLSKLMLEAGGKLIHVSTDCVFSGEKGNYVETDFKDARDIYGLSKALGEVVNGVDLTLRTSIIGPQIQNNSEGLFHWFMKQTGEVKGFTQTFWGGVTTLELSKVIDSAIEQNLTGLQHITNSTKISKFELIKLLKEIWNRENIRIIPDTDSISDKSLLSIRNDFDYQVPSYEQMLMDLKGWIDSHQNLYHNNYP